MTVGHKEVFSPVEVGIEKHRAEADVDRTDGGDARHPAGMLKGRPAKVAVEAETLALKVGHPEVGQPVEIGVADIGAHAALRLTGFAEGDAGDETTLGEGAVATVAVEPVGRGVVGDVEIGVAIEVDVGRHRPEPLAPLDNPGCRGGLSKPASPVGEPESVGHAAKLTWRADIAVALHHAGRIVVGAPVDIPHAVEIEMAIVIEVGCCGGRMPAVAGNAVLDCRHFAKAAVAHVGQQPESVVAGDQEIGEAVTVEVAHLDAVGVERPPQDAGLLA